MSDSLPARATLCFATLALVIALPGTAHATEDDDRVDASDARARARITTCLESYASEARASHLWLTGTALAVGAVGVGAGSVLTLREPSLPSVVLTANGALTLGVGLVGLVAHRDPFEHLLATLHRAQGGGLTDRETVSRVTLEWDAEAHRARVHRQRVGALGLAGGALLMVGGALVSFASADRLGMTNREQALTAGALITAGVAATSAGAYSLSVRSPIEQTRDPFGGAPEASRNLQVGVSPVAGGRGLFMAMGTTF